MYYDEASGDFVEGLPSNGAIASRSDVNRGSWLEGLLGVIMKAGTVAIIFMAGFLAGKFDVLSRIKEWGDKQYSLYFAAVPESKFFINCCNCNAQLDVTQYKHCDVFDCICTYCNARLRVASRNR